ncbi:hypothetical protein Nepgr_033498 [Nepenthes gracilis]|uniref:Uncharacterized protein n=1 Tax=Nepenthes gracilis TaxID=150966 RepID=A0AAD3TM55_NEPGR|nr:hypothetical protein Nepgr_033498 [Nepenthes gracilis]
MLGFHLSKSQIPHRMQLLRFQLDSLKPANVAVSVHVDHYTPVAPASQMQGHLNHLEFGVTPTELTDIAAVAVIGYREDQRTVAVAAENPGDLGVQVVASVVDPATVDYHLKD